MSGLSQHKRVKRFTFVDVQYPAAFLSAHPSHHAVKLNGAPVLGQCRQVFHTFEKPQLDTYNLSLVFLSV